MACKAAVFPELFGPHSTVTGPSSISASEKTLKLRTCNLVSKGCLGMRWGFFRLAGTAAMRRQAKLHW